jgi:hypothetical protein
LIRSPRRADVSLKATGQAFKQRYKNTTWAKKASVWA